MFTLIIIIQHHTRYSSKDNKARRRSKKTYRLKIKKLKMSLFAKDMAINVEISKHLFKKMFIDFRETGRGSKRET